jgi:hypothetical protein
MQWLFRRLALYSLWWHLNYMEVTCCFLARDKKKDNLGVRQPALSSNLLWRLAILGPQEA